MLRVILVNFVLLALPFVLYASYAWLVRKQTEFGDIFDGRSVLLLFSIGVSMSVAVMAYSITLDEGNTKGVYHPPVIENGKVKPGYFEPFKPGEGEGQGREAGR